MGKEGIVGLDAYAEANSIVGETLNAIRTVASFRGEPAFAGKYDDKLLKAKKSAIRAGVSAAIGGAGMMASMFLMYLSLSFLLCAFTSLFVLLSWWHCPFPPHLPASLCNTQVRPWFLVWCEAGFYVISL